MRSTCAVYVDAGYLLASAATRVTGTSLRNGIHVDFKALISGLVAQAEEAAGLPVLRVHWYDSAKDGVPDVQQERIGELPHVKLRLGRFGREGQQKGVDVRMGLDLVAHARNTTADVFFLVSGDDDLTEAVEEAQVHGVQVILLAVPNADGRPHGVSRHLLRAADELVVVTPKLVDAAVMRVEAPSPAPSRPVDPVPTSTGKDLATSPARPTIPTPADLMRRARPVPSSPRPAGSFLAYSGSTGDKPRVFTEVSGIDAIELDERIDSVVHNVLATFDASATREDREALASGRPSIPREIDRALLFDLSEALDLTDLDDRIRFRLRDRFWEIHDTP